MTSDSETTVETATRWVVDPAHSSVEFAVKHMVIATVRGRFTQFDVKLEADEEHPERSQVVAAISAASIDTRNPDRDAHLRSADFFDAEQHPELRFVSRYIEPAGENRGRIVGDLTIRGVTREVALDTAFTGRAKSPWGQEVAGFSAETTINRKDFGLTWNRSLETGGVLVADEIRISIEIEAIRQQG